VVQREIYVFVRVDLAVIDLQVKRLVYDAPTMMLLLVGIVLQWLKGSRLDRADESVLMVIRQIPLDIEPSVRD
jgi:hypothetical protein